MIYGANINEINRIVRKVDDLGRVVIPIELRRTLDISVKDPLEIYVDTDKIVLKNICQLVYFAAALRTLNFNGKIFVKMCCRN